MALAAVSAALAPRISTAGLTAAFATVAAVVGIRMAAAGDWRLRDALPGRPVQAGLAGMIGWLSSWMRIGARVSVSAPALLVCLWSMSAAPAVPGSSLGYIQLLPLTAILVPMVLLAPFGARMAKSLPARNRRRMFGIFLFCVSVALFDRAMR